MRGSSVNEDTAANERDQTRHGEGPVEDKHGVQAFLTHEVTARKKVVSLVETWLARKRKSVQRWETHQSSLASAVSPAMEIPIWLSTWRIFFWCAASSDWALCTSTQPPIFVFKKEKLFVKQTSDRTFNATRTAWVLDLSPTVAEPCFTASIAYSI